ncbi:MAG TPA: hypothetical protein VK211_21055 [Kamptonema sp.]|nr:hypothetical protein [Kamptonema sp.]
MTSASNEIDQRLERLESEFAEFRDSTTASMTRLERLTGELLEIAQLHQRAFRISEQKQDRTDAAIQTLLTHGDVVNRNLDQLTDLVGQLAQNAEVDRAETRRIWEYLQSQQRSQGNGHG